MVNNNGNIANNLPLKPFLMDKMENTLNSKRKDVFTKYN